MASTTPVIIENIEEFQFLADSINNLDQSIFVGVVFLSFLFIFSILRS